MRKSDLTGKKFGRLTGISRSGSNKSGQSIWTWECECGARVEALATNVTSGKKQSCGCLQSELRTKHGLYKTPTYKAWIGMKARVSGASEVSKKYYVPKGISVSPAWRDDFLQFLLDMGECPPGMTLERKDNDLGYSPENCCWATRSEQSANTRRTHMVTYKGERMCLSHACKKAHKDYRTAMKKMAKGASAQSVVDEFP